MIQLISGTVCDQCTLAGDEQVEELTDELMVLLAQVRIDRVDRQCELIDSCVHRHLDTDDDDDVYYSKGRRPREDEEGEESYEKQRQWPGRGG